MTCIEAGVVSGLNAVQSVVDRHGGPPVEIIQPRDYPPMLFAWLRLVWMPYAATAKMWSTGSDIMSAIARRMGIERSTLRNLFMPTRRRAQR